MFEKYIVRFKDNFNLARKVATTRVLLARKYFVSDDELRTYSFLRNTYESRRVTGFLDCLSKVLGYAWGNYTTYCPTQKQLNYFDEGFERLEGELEIFEDGREN